MLTKAKICAKEFWSDMAVKPFMWMIHHPIGFCVYVLVSIIVAFIPFFGIGLIRQYKESKEEFSEEEESE